MELVNIGCCLKLKLRKRTIFTISREKLKFNGSEDGEGSVKEHLMEH